MNKHFLCKFFKKSSRPNSNQPNHPMWLPSSFGFVLVGLFAFISLGFGNNRWHFARWACWGLFCCRFIVIKTPLRFALIFFPHLFSIVHFGVPPYQLPHKYSSHLSVFYKSLFSMPLLLLHLPRTLNCLGLVTALLVISPSAIATNFLRSIEWYSSIGINQATPKITIEAYPATQATTTKSEQVAVVGGIVSLGAIKNFEFFNQSFALGLELSKIDSYGQYHASGYAGGQLTYNQIVTFQGSSVQWSLLPTISLFEDQQQLFFRYGSGMVTRRIANITSFTSNTFVRELSPKDTDTVCATLPTNSGYCDANYESNHFGVGWAYRLTDTLSVVGEYRQTNFDDPKKSSSSAVSISTRLYFF